MIRITSKTDGFRRCGMAHPKEPTEYPDDRFSKKELDILKNESMLFVEMVESDPAEIAKTPALKDMTVPQLKELLDNLEVEYDAKALKSDLIMLIEEKTAEPPEE